tara:strand:+ start:1923 stop:2132 length:210 start_codon:yes stop_codon:yes gene_type:complete
MSYELVKSWIDDQSSVTEDQINEAMEAMYLLPPSGPNQNLLAALSYIQDTETNDAEIVSLLISKYETQT